MVRLALFTGTETFRGLSASHLRDVVDVWEWEETEAPGLRQAKRPIALLAVKMDALMLLKKLVFRFLTGLLTGDSSLNNHLHQMSLAASNVCWLCRLAPDLRLLAS